MANLPFTTCWLAFKGAIYLVKFMNKNTIFFLSSVIGSEHADFPVRCFYNWEATPSLRPDLSPSK